MFFSLQRSTTLSLRGLSLWQCCSAISLKTAGGSAASSCVVTDDTLEWIERGLVRLESADEP